MKHLTLLLLFITASFAAIAQKLELSGVIKEANGQPLPGVGVYIAGSKMAISTDTEGRFKFVLDPGKYDLLFQAVGFAPANRNVSLETGNVQVTIVLKEKAQEVGEVVIRPDKDREYFISVFKDFFIGKTPNSSKTKLLNPQTLNVDFDSKTRKLRVTADAFLELENEALGYKIKYLLQNFEYDFKSSIVFYEGFPTFEEMPGGASKQNKWNRMRLIAYNGSMQHFFRALANKTADRDGFILHKVVQLKDSEKSNLSRPGVNIVNSRQAGMLRRENILVDTLVHQGANGSYFLNFKDELYVMYTKENEIPSYKYTGYWQSRPFDIPDHQISRITPLQLPLKFFKNGSPADPAYTLYSGYFAYEKVGDQLPIEYEPPTK